VPRASSAAASNDKPIDLGTTEKVEVRLVTIQVVVTTANGKTVPDLRKSDFELTVDGEAVPVDTLDLDCPSGAIEDARKLGRDKVSQVPGTGGEPRHIVVALDFYHLGFLSRNEVYRSLKLMFKEQIAKDDEVMLVAMGNGVRVEQPFTKDRQQIMSALLRMQHDITLWAGDFSHINEHPLFSSLESLLDLLSTQPGSKALVLFSDGPGPGNYYDLQFKSIAGLATSAGTAIYPVASAGLTPGGFG
jgi:VWFA-related protein